MTDKSSQQKEFVFISVDGKQTKNIAISPPENLKIESPPTFTDSELGRNHDKKMQGKSKKPPNAFILFRKKYVESLHRLGHRDAMKKVSGWARDAWNKLPQMEKEQYEHYANKAATFYQEWEIKNPQLVRQKQTKKTKKASQITQNIKPIVQTQQMPVQYTTPTSSPESIELTEEESRNYFSFDPNLIYFTTTSPTDFVYEQPLYDYGMFNNNLESSIPNITNITPTLTTDFQNFNYNFDFGDFYNPNVHYRDNSQIA
ncbi:20364_t:CDS:1 [Funneliformis geosporum]|uniref:11684_t:CDS:1 n=1 Tax=Funneliformis geosporum TaxID=1117311 RepID=A0A9W4SBJ2_9GLOM|nr:20364_t:CDS:1 [Funneliformis geosporum]CAI2163778.1 11684_t:CDS:1 [Funneliformis geosporum]